MATTQDFVPIQDIKENIALLKNGDMAIVLETSSVNFGLLSSNEQIAIISAFAGLLNSLSFSIQIVIRSKRLDITDYIKLLDSAYQKQTNPLLANMMIRYRKFIESTVRDNEVLDKQFFIVIAISYLELGFTKTSEPDMKKAMTLLLPRRDHIVRQLSRIGLKANQLNTKQLVQLFYDIYNFDPSGIVENYKSSENSAAQIQEAVAVAKAKQATDYGLPTTVENSQQGQDSNQNKAGIASQGLAMTTMPVSSQPVPDAPQVVYQNQVPPTTNTVVLQVGTMQASNQSPGGQPGVNYGQNYAARNNVPFVVEELKDDFDSGVVGR